MGVQLESMMSVDAERGGRGSGILAFASSCQGILQNIPLGHDTIELVFTNAVVVLLSAAVCYYLLFFFAAVVGAILVGTYHTHFH